MKLTPETMSNFTPQETGRLRGAARSLSSLPFYSLAIGLAAWLVSVVPMATEMLQFDRSAIGSGELWRIVTCHWTHWNGEHLLWDVIVFVALGMACEHLGRAAFLLCVAAGAPLISLSVWLFLPQMEYYRGLSGFDAAFYMLAGVALLVEGDGRRLRKIFFFVLLMAPLAAKVGYEALYMKTIFVKDMAGYVPVPVAHIAGGVLGAVIGFMSFRGAGRGCRGSQPPLRIAPEFHDTPCSSR